LKIVRGLGDPRIPVPSLPTIPHQWSEGFHPKGEEEEMRTTNKSPPMLMPTALLLGVSLSVGCDPGKNTTGPAAITAPVNATSGARLSPAKISLAVGQPAPKFTLKDQTGKERSLDEFLGKKTVALTFHRSAIW
jgi:hypothetical protein